MGSMVWIDMEDSSYVDRTLEIFRAARERYDGVGICLQAYLRRTDDDLDALLPLKPSIRVVKGAYLEPPDVAYPEKREVDGAFHHGCCGRRRSVTWGAWRWGPTIPG